MGTVNSYYSTPMTMSVPTWIPRTTSMLALGSTESFFVNESWWSSVSQCATVPTKYAILYNVGKPFHFLDKDFHPAAPRSTTIVHFGRVLGPD